MPWLLDLPDRRAQDLLAPQLHSLSLHEGTVAAAGLDSDGRQRQVSA